SDAPDNPKELIHRLLDGPTNGNPGAPAQESLSFADYSAFFASLPMPVQRAVAERWGPAERDPFFRPSRLDCGRFAIPGFRAGSYGPMAELERLIDEYYEAALGDSRRLPVLASAVLEQARATGIEGDCGITASDQTASALRKLDGFLCELKELQIRDGLHVFGRSPEGERLHSLLVAFARPGRGAAPEDASLMRALAADLGLGQDPLDEDPAEPWTGARPSALAGPGPWRSCGDTVERLEA